MLSLFALQPELSRRAVSRSCNANRLLNHFIADAPPTRKTPASFTGPDFGSMIERKI
jgi:hypothetical protein